MFGGVALMAVAVLVPSSAGATVAGPGVTVEVENTPYSSGDGECDEDRNGWHIIMNGLNYEGDIPTADDFGPVNLMFSDGSTAQALFTDVSSGTVAHFLNDTVNQDGPFEVTAAAMTFPDGTSITSFNKFVISHPPCNTIVTTTTTVPDTTTTTSPVTTETTTTVPETTTTVPDTTTTVPDTTTTVPETTTTTSPVTTETTTTVPETTTTVPETTTTVPETTTTTSPVTTETTTTVPDTTTTTSPVTTETTTTTSPVSTETTTTVPDTTTTISPVITVPTTTIPPGTPTGIATVDTVVVERQVQAARTARAATGSTLPATGIDGGPFVLTGLLLLAAGTALLVITRRKATA
jgi:LPXTG-motif cell wall-anchored protein